MLAKDLGFFFSGSADTVITLCEFRGVWVWFGKPFRQVRDDTLLKRVEPGLGSRGRASEDFTR